MSTEEPTSTSEQRQPRARPVVIAPPPKALADCDRLTVNLQLHHETCGEQPVTVLASFSHASETQGEQPWQRRGLKIGEEESELDMGWVADNPGYLTIENKVGAGLTLLPSDEQKAFFATQVLEIVGTPFIVRPGRFFCGEIGEGPIRLRSRAGIISVSVTIMPR